MLGEEIDVVGDDHQVAYMEMFVHAARGIGYEEGFDTQFVHHTYGEGHILHCVTFIEVETALHSEDINTAEFSENQFATMTFHCGYREVWNLRIGNLFLVSYF